MNIRSSFFAVTAALLICSIGSVSAQTSSKPNVVFIMLDDMNDFAGFLEGHPQTETPHLDALAREGTVFENAFCNSPICAPSRTSLMSGKDASYTGVYANSGAYASHKVFRTLFDPANGNGTVYTLPEIMKDSGGYYTANFHKIYHGWEEQGFDNDFDYTTTDPCSKTKSWSQFGDYGLSIDEEPYASDQYNQFHHGLEKMRFGPLRDEQEEQMNDYLAMDDAISFINTYSANPSNYCDKPFMLAVGLYRPHAPYFAPERYYLDFYERDYSIVPYPTPYNNPPDLFPPNGIMHPGLPDYEGQDFNELSYMGQKIALGADSAYLLFNKFTDYQLPLPQIAPGLDTAERKAIITESHRGLAVMAYLAGIKFADLQIGRLMHTLKTTPGMLENTIIVVTSDNGYSLREHHHYHKAGLWDTDIRVPLIIVDPRKPSNQVCRKTVSLIDLYPTILELTEVDEPVLSDGSAYLDGHSLVPYLENTELPLHRPVITSYRAPGFYSEATCFPHFSIRSEQYHYIRYQSNGGADGSCVPDSSIFHEELYEIGEQRNVDPHEWKNLAGFTIYDELKDYLSQWLPDGPFFNTIAPQVEIETGSLPGCEVGAGDVLNMSVNYTDGKGATIAAPAGLQYNWKIFPGSYTFTGPTLNLDLTSLDTALWGQFLTVQLTAEDPSASVPYKLFDQVRFRLAIGSSNPSFVAGLNENIVSIDSYNKLFQIGKSTWDYGDGFVWEKERPVSHSYSAPGTYTITRTVELLNPGIAPCEVSQSQTITIGAGNFPAGYCEPPSAIAATDVSSAKVMINWANTFNADSYKLEYIVSNREYFTTWKKESTTDVFHKMINLVPATEYTVRVSSICGTTESRLSHPIKVLSDSCHPPTNFIITPNSNYISINWQSGAGDASLQRVGYRLKPAFGAPPVLIHYPPSIHASAIFGLSPGTNYELRGQNVCAQFDGSTVPGILSSSNLFTTLTLRENDLLTKLELFPNPTSKMLTLSFNSKVDGNGTLEIRNMLGTAMHAEQFELRTGDSNKQLDISELTEGYYLLHLFVNGEEEKVLPFVKAAE